MTYGKLTLSVAGAKMPSGTLQAEAPTAWVPSLPVWDNQ